MKILYLWPLLFLLLIPIIIIFYILKQKAVEKPISSLFLWQEMYHNAEANTPWEKLKKNWLMILQMITLLIMIFAICSPYLLKGGTGADHAVVVIDNSASMSTIYEGDRTRLDVAIEEAVTYVKGLRGGTGISVIVSSADAVMVYSDGQTKNQAIEQIRAIQPTNIAGDAQAGIEMVKAMQTQWKSVETVCFTDTQAAMSEVEGYIVDLYIPADNLCVDYVSHGYSNGKLVILARISNHGKEEKTLDANLYGADELLQIRSVQIPAGESEVVYFDDFVFEGDAVSVELSVQDALEGDNVGYDVLEEDEVTEILLMTEANLYLEKAMGILQGNTVTKSNDIASFDEFKKQNYDIYIFDGMVPETLPENGNIIIMNVPDTELFTHTELLAGVRVETCEHEISQYLDEFYFGVSDTYAYNVPEWAMPFLTVGNKAVGFSGEYNGRNICVLGFDLHNSDLPLKTEFPVLVYNMISTSSIQELANAGIYHPGDTISVYGKIDETLPVITKPDGTTFALQDYHYNFTETQTMGVYRIQQQTDKGMISTGVAVNFPTEESNILHAPSAMAEEEAEMVKTSVSGVLDLRNIIILLALLFLGIEWIAYLRK